jgi:phosphotransferase system  glucose/maltose/N-acetylglucosamine-specific IIC component
VKWEDAFDGFAPFTGDVVVAVTVAMMPVALFSVMITPVVTESVAAMVAVTVTVRLR